LHFFIGPQHGARARVTVFRGEDGGALGPILETR
jgi:hypothetical protein